MNRQVPTNCYLIIGRGRLATHWAAYFNLKNIPYLQWSRVDSSEDLQRFAKISQRILLAISDDAIEAFVSRHQLPIDKTIHFSGALSTPMAFQQHPLMTFSNEIYDLETYESISFVSPHGSPMLKALIPELSNKHYFIPEGRESFYHALCVLSGNGTTLLWQKTLEQFENTLGLPREVVWPYLEQIVFNLQKDYPTALTGPWARNDQRTIFKNQQALHNTPLADLYRSLLSLKNSNTQAPQGVSYENRT